MQNCQIPEFLQPPSFTRIWAPLISGCKPKFKNQALDCCCACWKVSKLACHNLIAQKLTKKIGSLKWTFARPQTWWWTPGNGSPTQQHNFCCVLTVKIWPRFNPPVKSYSIYAHRQTHILHPYRRGEIFSLQKFVQFHFTMFICSLCSLIHSICEG